jgi:Fe-S cluster assembly scaffold protein SufB
MLRVVIQPFKTGLQMSLIWLQKRAYVYENGHMEWIDGNIGSQCQHEVPIMCITW